MEEKRDEEQIRDLDSFGNRFFLIAYLQLKEAETLAPLVRDDAVLVAVPGTRLDSRHDKRRMAVTESCLISIIASAAAVETEILSLAYFLHGQMLKKAPPEEAQCFGLWFVKNKRGYSQMMNGEKDYDVAGAKKLYGFAEKITGAFGAGPSWPCDAYKGLAEVRNRHIHQSIMPTKGSPGQPPLVIHPDVSIGASRKCFDISLACLRTLKAMRPLFEDDAKFETAMKNLNYKLKPRDQWPPSDKPAASSSSSNSSNQNSNPQSSESTS
jgi:hypothetical protein